MSKKEKEPSEVLADFLNYIDQCRHDYQAAHDAVGMEDKRLQDLLHGLEFAADENEKRRAGTKLQQSRRIRRQEKDEVKRLGKQRKEEEYLNGERHYNNRIKE